MTIKPPNKVLYFIGFVVGYPLLKLLFQFKIDRSNYIAQKGSFMVVSNHQSYLDFLLPTLALYPRRFNAVAAQKFFFFKTLNWLMTTLGCIPKNLFDADARCIKGIIEVLRRGDNVLLFPEGRCTVAGEYMGIQKATGKLVKKMKVPVVSCYIEGAYNCMPFWRKGFRAGQVRVTIENLFSAEDCEALTIDEINEVIDAKLSGKDTTRTERLRTLRANKLAEGLQNILYYCVKCGKEFTLETKGNTIFCTHCGNSASLDRAGRFVCSEGSVAPETIQDWQREQNLYELQSLNESMTPLKLEVTVQMPSDTPGAGIEPKGEGVLILTPKGWTYEGQLREESVDIFFPLESVAASPFDPDEDFQIYHHGTLYLFTPTNARACAKYATIAECAYWRFMPEPQMTLGKNNGLDLSEAPLS